MHDIFWNCFEEIATDNLRNVGNIEKSVFVKIIFVLNQATDFSGCQRMQNYTKTR